MARRNIKVDFGFELPEETVKGTVFVIDAFETVTDRELAKIFRLADTRDFDKLVFYPQNDNTLKRMGMEGIRPYHRRVDYLSSLLEEVDNGFIPFTLDTWEGKRKKYTPIETAVKFLMEKSKGPYFLYVTSAVANEMIKYSSFETLIKQVRLLIDVHYTEQLNPKFNKYKNRWEIV